LDRLILLLAPVVDALGRPESLATVRGFRVAAPPVADDEVGYRLRDQLDEREAAAGDVASAVVAAGSDRTHLPEKVGQA